MLRLGELEDGTFLEPEVGFCLHGLATSGGVMEALCRAQASRSFAPNLYLFLVCFLPVCVPLVFGFVCTFFLCVFFSVCLCPPPPPP